MPRNDRKKIEPRYPKLLELTEAVRQEYCHGGINRDEQFLPQDSQEQFVTLDNVSPALSEACKDDSGNVNQRDFNDLTEIVRKRDCKRLFLTLVMMTWREKEMLSCLIDMVQAEIRDDSLPLEFASDETGRKYAYSLENAESSQRWYIPFEGWEDNDFTTFRFYQWHFLAPVFGADKKFRHQLDRKVPLPFLAVARNPASSGFFGEVSRAEIHPAHIDPKRIPALRAVRHPP
jgi:hypothetical protein